MKLMPPEDKERIVRKGESLWKPYIIDWKPKATFNQQAFDEGKFLAKSGLDKPEGSQIINMRPDYGYDGMIDFIEGYHVGTVELRQEKLREAKAIEDSKYPICVEILQSESEHNG